MAIKKDTLCYEAGINAITHIINLRKKKNKDQFDCLDEDKNVPFVVPVVTWDSVTQTGFLNNDHWAFNVGYGFREALDFIFMERVRNKQKVYRWSQGPIIAFKEGDLIRSKDNKRSVQVRFANPMGWDADKNEMYYGSVTYFESNSLETKILSQIDFLNLLITGKEPSECI
ncbi:hypothetical protein [Photobacterium leiognathi]|uniref:hypothetical protein n=1 Tax=Photobacterium leiognathi TaxID=553611 RepID=UPI003DA0169B